MRQDAAGWYRHCTCTIRNGVVMSTVLVIDDASIMRMVMKDILLRYCKYEKFNIHEASDGHEALNKFARVKPDVVLCDISMPGMNGIDVVKSIIEKDPNAKIIMITASNDEADVVECIKAGAKDYIIKPPKPERVMLAIKRISDNNPLSAMEAEQTDAENDELEEETADVGDADEAAAEGEQNKAEKVPDELTEQAMELRAKLESEK